MASSHSSSPVPQGSSSDVFFKKEVDPTKHIRPVQSLPDVCPKEPTDPAKRGLSVRPLGQVVSVSAVKAPALRPAVV